MPATFNEIPNKFAHITKGSESTPTYFSEVSPYNGQTNYYEITGDTSSEATLSQVYPVPSSGTYNVVPFDSIAFVVFEDGTTAIVTHCELYGKTADASGSSSSDSTPVKMVDVQVGEGEQGEFPTHIQGSDCPYQVGDIVVVRSAWSGVAQNFKVGRVFQTTDMDDSGVTVWNVNYELIYDSKAIDDRLKALEDFAQFS